MKILRVLKSFALLTVAGAATLRADFKDFSNRCFPGAVRACASIQVYTYDNGSGGTVAFILVRNLQGGGWGIDNTGGSILTRIGLATPTPLTPNSGLIVFTSGFPYAPGLVDVGGLPNTGGSHGTWSLASAGGIGGSVEITAAGLTPAPGATGSVAGGITGCDAPGIGGFPSDYYRTCGPAGFDGWVGFAFSTSNSWSANDAEVLWLTQRSGNPNGPDGFQCGSVAVGDSPECTVVTPEPVTMLLLGSGLAGVGGVGVIRRRRGKDVISD